MIPITPITRKEWEAVKYEFKGRRGHPEWDAVRALHTQEGITFPCRWRHINGQCTAISSLSTFRKRTDLVLHGRCKDGQVYIWRES